MRKDLGSIKGPGFHLLRLAIEHTNTAAAH